MSGPIVRHYGFPNFEKIFGKRALEHGVDDTETSERQAEPEKTQPDAPETGTAPDAEEQKRSRNGS